MPTFYLLHLAGARGVLCSGPSRGAEATFVRAEAWVPGWSDLPPERAEEELLRTYLAAFAPATPEDFMAWTRMLLSEARAVWSRVVGELAPVDVEGWAAWVLRKDLPDLDRSVPPGESVRLLPYFDSYVLGHRNRGHLAEAAALKRVFRPQGWVAPVLLLNGRVRGEWSHEVERGRLRVRVRPNSPLPRTVARAVRDEAADLGRFLGARQTEVRFA